MAQKKSTEVEKSAPVLELERLSPSVREMVESVAGTISVEDKFEISLSIIDRILNAETEEDVFAAVGALVHSRDELVNVPIEVTDVRYNVSRFEGETSLGFYAVFDFVDLRNNVKKTGSVGSLNCMAQLYRLAKLGKLPAELKLSRTAAPTASGFYPLFFVPLSETDRENIGNTDYLEEKFDPADEGR